MKEIELSSWSDFHDAIKEIRKDYGNWVRTSKKNGSEHTGKSTILFRGQPNNEWKLKTTLERTTNSKYSILSYLKRAESVVSEVESATGARWNLPTYHEIKEEITNSDNAFRPIIPDSYYPYIVYLRHHGFPSPLLDWTRSPYIAAYFAVEQSCEADRCSVIAFIEMPMGMKTQLQGNVLITSLRPYITTHSRHFAQKSSYTIATQWDIYTKEDYFSSHEDVTHCEFHDQDVLMKITFPRSDRATALEELDDYNINHYTLFQTEDSLVRSIGLRAFDMNDK